MHYRIIFKICPISYQALASKQPTYLNSMLTPARNSRELRSTSSNPLYIPRVKTKAGTRAFSVAAPTLWNSLPVSVKSEGLRSQVVYSKQPKLGLTQEFVVLLVRMRLVVCMYVCMFVCLFVCYNLFVCLFYRQFRWLGVGKGRFIIAAWKAMGFSIAVMCGGIMFQMRIARG